MNLTQLTLEEMRSHSRNLALERVMGNCKGTSVAELQQWDWVDSWRKTDLRESGEIIIVLALDGAAL